MMWDDKLDLRMSTKCLVQPEDDGWRGVIIIEICRPIKSIIFSSFDSLQEDISSPFDNERCFKRSQWVNGTRWKTTDLYRQVSTPKTKTERKENSRRSGELYKYPAMGTSESKKWPSWGITAQEKWCSPDNSLTKIVDSRRGLTLILLGIRSSCRSEERNAKNVSLTWKSVLRLREYGNTVTKLAKVSELNEQSLMSKYKWI